MNYYKRVGYYVFTVTNNDIGEKFFQELRKINRIVDGKAQLFRMGRNRDRSNCGGWRKQGRLPLRLSDRWDLYVRVPVYNNEWHNHKYNQTARTLLFIRRAADLIARNSNVIEYCNETHKSLFIWIFNSSKVLVNPKDVVSVPVEPSSQTVLTAAGIPPKVNPANRDVIVNDKNEMTTAINKGYETMNKPVTTVNSLWKVSLKSEISVQGNEYSDLLKTLKSLGFEERDIVFSERVDLHKDLPLVQFSYPLHGDTKNGNTPRLVRVTKMDCKTLEGYDGNIHKTFLMNKIVGNVYLVEVPAKNN